MATTTNNNEISFRNKFLPLITEENRQVIVSAFSKFCSLNPETTNALDILWNLTYSPKSDSWALQSLGLNPEDFSDEAILKFRDELRYQYVTRVCPNYFERGVSEEAHKAFAALSNKAGIIVASVVYARLQQHVFSNNVERSLALLEHKREECYFGGLKNIGFTYSEAIQLKKFHLEIHALLKCLWDLHQQNNPSSINTPFVGLNLHLEEAGMNVKELPFSFGNGDSVGLVPTEAPTESPANEVFAEEPLEKKNSTSFKKLTPEAILEHEDLFRNVIRDRICLIHLTEIVQAGFDLNEVFSKSRLIKSYLDAIELSVIAEKDFSRAQTSMDKAKEKLNNAINQLMA